MSPGHPFLGPIHLFPPVSFAVLGFWSDLADKVHIDEFFLEWYFYDEAELHNGHPTVLASMNLLFLSCGRVESGIGVVGKGIG